MAMRLAAEGKELVTRAFEKLGPERLERGLTADGHTWDNCFFARIYGEDGALERRHAGQDISVVLGQLYGLSPQEVEAVVAMYDREEERFRSLAKAWLEQDRSGRRATDAAAALSGSQP